MNDHTQSTMSKDTYLFLLGAGVGSGLALLLAPRSGQDTRNALRSSVNEGKIFMTRQGQDLADKACDMAEEGRETLERGRDTLTAAVDSSRQAYREATGQSS